jgi:hypothetical protein
MNRGSILSVAAAFVVGLLVGAVGRTAPGACPKEMVDTGVVCIDRYEASLLDQSTRQLLSPYYPPDFRLLGQIYSTWELQRRSVGPESARNMPLPALSDFQRRGEYALLAVSEKDSVPQAYLSYYSAKRACENAGKRLCSDEEWLRACRGERNQTHPYGADYRLGQCNVGSYQHPASVLHGLSSSGHLDPRLNLLVQESGERVLGRTGSKVSCRSAWGADGAFDMVGNLDEWVEADPPKFRGGFYARGTTRGCDSEVKNHAPTYFDYSTGVRCCRERRR